MLKEKQLDVEDSNLANYGSKEHKDLRKSAAASEKEFVGAGQKPGLEVWRVENKRTKSDTPDFGVKRWPKEDYGCFFTGDSYIVLNTYRVKVDGKETDKLGWDVHFWLGDHSSQDEIGVAAYKTVELDDLLDDGPVQHRETQGHESPLFQSYFGGIRYMEGGIASGFRQVKPEEYKPRLMQVRQSAKSIRAFEVPVTVKSLNKGDTFILDAGTKIFLYIGEHSSAFEKSKGGALAANIVSSRLGKAKLISEVDDEFWKILGGSAKDVSDVIPERPEKEEAALDPGACKLFRISDASGAISFTKVAEGQINAGMFDTNDVFVLDGKTEIFVWVGNRASAAEKSQSMKLATQYLEKEGKPKHLPVTALREGQVHHVFGALVKW